MKKILLYIPIVAAILLTSCESELNDRHFNPDGFTDAKIEYLYATGIIRTVENDYADHWNYVFRLLGTYTQTLSRESGASRTDLYTIQNDKGRWDNFYVKRMQELIEMDKIYNYKLSDQQKPNYAPYMETAKVLKSINTTMATDFFGAMPYSEAWGSRNDIYGQPVLLKPKYDSQKDIYYSVLSDLEDAAKYLSTQKLDESVELHKVFKKQDIIYGGDFSKWYKFANSLRLRFAMRISNVDEAKAKQELAGLKLEDLIIDNKDNAYTRVSTNNSDKGIWRALIESQDKNNGYAFAPQLMVDILKGANDPRLNVFFQPASNEKGVVIDKTKPIIAYPSSADDAIAIMGSTQADERRRTYGVVNTVTFRNNDNLPYGVGITASDVYFLLAEARSRNLIGWGSAEEFYNKGIVLSVQEYFDYYKNSTEKSLKDADIAATDVSESTLLSWIASSSYKFDQSKALEQIATQKWMHFGILQPWENWTEYRRTDLPVLLDDKENGVLLNQGKAPVRFLYPANEMSMNAQNYATVSDQNYPDKKLWWDVK